MGQFDGSEMTGRFSMDQWNNMNPEQARVYGADYMNGGLAGSSSNPWYTSGFTNKAGNFDLGKTLGTTQSVIGLAGSLVDLFGGSPELKEGKRVNDAQIKNMERMAKNSETAYNNQLARGASARRGVSGGTDPLSRVG